MPYVTLNPETRKMTLPDEYRHFGVESDEKSKRIEFQFPRFVDDIDLNDFNLYINYSNANNEKGLSIAEDVVISEDEITFAWVLSRHVTEYKGNVNFIVCAKKSIGEFRVQNEWNTRIATADVEQGLEVHHLVESMSADAINKLLSDLLALEPQVEQNTAARHTHPNKSIVDDIGEIDGTLSYKGLPVSIPDSRIDDILSLIPDDASETNQLADKEFVDESIENVPKFKKILSDGDIMPVGKIGDYVFQIRVENGQKALRRLVKIEDDLWSYTHDRAYILTNDEYAAAHSGITSSKVSEYDSTVADVDSLKELIPEDASSENQLADKAFVNDSISTNAAYFRGTFNSLAELQAYSGPVTNNDYAYVIVKDEYDPNVIKSYQRYKYSVNQWLYEYEIGIHDLTADQLAALNSGVTSETVEDVTTLKQNLEGFKNESDTPYFGERKLALEKKDVVLMPMGEKEGTINVNPNWDKVTWYTDEFPLRGRCIKDDIEIELMVGTDPDDYEYGFFGPYVHVGEDTYRYRNSRWEKDGEETENPLTDVVFNGFGIGDYYWIENYDDVMDLYPKEYETLCRIFNYDQDYGEVLSDDNTYIPAHEGINAESNKSYVVDFDLNPSGSCTIYLPTFGFTKYEESSVVVLVHITAEEQIISFMSDRGSGHPIYLYNGQPVDLTEIGYYRVIATWNPQLDCWCLASAKMEEPS